MASLGVLKTQATNAAEFRGHIMIWSAPHHGEHRSNQSGHCALCGMEAHITTRPAPNGIDVHGEAVALDCLGVLPKISS